MKEEMSNLSNRVMDYLPGPSSQQPRPQSHHLAANNMSYQNPNQISNPNLGAYSNPQSSMPNPNTYPYPTSMQANPPISPNSYPNQPNTNTTFTPQGTNAIPNTYPSQDVQTDPKCEPAVLPSQNPNPNSDVFQSQNVQSNPISTPNITTNPESQNTPFVPTSFSDPNPLPVPDPDPTPSAKTFPPPSLAPETSSPTPSTSQENYSVASTSSETAPAVSPNIPPISSPEPARSTLPNPNLSLAGKLSENIRRSKRQKATSKTVQADVSKESQADPPARPSKRVKKELVPDSTSMEIECPKEYLIENAYTDRLRFNNEVAKVVYRDDFARFSTKEEFQKYLAAQQKWRWEIYNIATTLDTRVHNLTANRNSGIAQNVIRYSTIPLNCKSDDVRRCEKTAKELEKMILRIETTKADMLTRRGLFDDKDEAVAGELDFLDEMVEKIGHLKVNVDSLLTKVNETLQNICRRFTTESVEAAELRRQKRRKKENLKKKRKSQERQLEKKVIETMLKLTSKEVTERVLTGGELAKVSCDEISGKELEAMTSLNEVGALHTILVREYLDEDASKLVKGVLAKCK